MYNMLGKTTQFISGEIICAKIYTVVFLLVLLSAQGVVLADQSPPSLKDVVSDSAEATNDIQGSVAVESEPRKLVKEGPDDEFDRGVPRNSVEGYFKAIKSGDADRAAEYLDLRKLPPGYKKDDGPRLARELKVVLDRKLWVEMDLLSTEAKGHSEDGLPSYRDLVGQIEVNEIKYDILLQHVRRADGVFIWKFAKKTVLDIPELYDALGYGPIGEKLSDYLPAYEFMGLQAWQWAFLVVIAITAFLGSLPIIRLASWFIRRRKTALSLLVARFVNGPLHAVLVVVLVRQFFYLIHPSLVAQAISKGATGLIIVFVWMLIRFLVLYQEYYTQKLAARGRDNAIVLLGPAVTTLKLIIIFLGLLIWLDNIGFSVTTVLAGLGVGGIAVALATQKSIENFIGALTLYVAAPVKVGDFCRFTDKMGEIEEIGLRATKIRTLENTIITVPNAEFAAMQIENLTERKRYRFNPDIQLHFETTATQIRDILAKLQDMLKINSRIIESPQRVNFVGFAGYSLDIEIHCYIDTIDIAEYKNIAEDLHLQIMDIVQTAGTRLSIPSELQYSPQEFAPKPSV